MPGVSYIDNVELAYDNSELAELFRLTEHFFLK